MTPEASPWPHVIGIGEARRDMSVRLVADEAARAVIAKALGIEALDAEVDQFTVRR